MTYYIVEIHEPTNHPGDYIHKKIFQSKAKAEKYIDEYLEHDYTDVEDLSGYNEWDDSGDNWTRIKVLDCGDFCILLDEVDNGVD